MIKPRTKVVFFRVSQAEFSAMEQACESVGARSLSDFARMATRRLLAAQQEDGVFALQERLRLIDSHLERLCSTLEKPNAIFDGGGAGADGHRFGSEE